MIEHQKVRALIEMSRDDQIFEMVKPQKRMAYLGYAIAREKCAYLQGGRYRMEAEDGPATWSRGHAKHSLPSFDCAGFMEALMFGCGYTSEDMFSHYGLRKVPHDTEFWKTAAAGDEDYHENWIPGTNRPPTITDLNDMGVWPQTPYLLFYRQEFVELRRRWPQEGDLVFFLSKDTAGFHTHVGVWSEFDFGAGLVHCSPSSKWDDKDGPKFTRVDSEYWEKLLRPMAHFWNERFGAYIVRRKEWA